MANSWSCSSSKLVNFVVIPLILLTGILYVFNPKSASTYSWPSFNDRVRYGTLPTEAQPPVRENEESKKDGEIRIIDNLEMVEASLVGARATIQEAQRNNESSFDPDYVPTGPFYRNANAFHRSYLEMEKRLKIYIYEEGEPPVFHYSTSTGVLGMEGILIHQIEISKFRTRNPNKAHLYFIPLSVQSIIDYAYDRQDRRWASLQNIASDYIRLISTKHPYWNRTSGRDHFLLGCQDWTPVISLCDGYLYNNSIRVLCNANTSEGFKPSIDVSMPEIYLPEAKMDGLIGGPPPSERSVLVFYAGGVHGYIRQVRMKQWKDKDPDVQVHEYLPKNVSYYGMIRKSKYCICASGWEVASPRMVEALYMGCVPVLLNDSYAKPFDDVLNWSTFAVDISSRQIPDLKNILMAIPHQKYVEMQRVGILVRRHFEVNFPPKRYDVFHMILHSIWLRRINVQLHDTSES